MTKETSIDELDHLKRFIEERAVLVEGDYRHDDKFSMFVIHHNDMARISNMINDLRLEIKNIEEKEDE